MAFHAISQSSALVGAWPATSPGDELYAVVSVDNGSFITPPSGWTIIGSSQVLTQDAQFSALYRYTGNGGSGAPASPPASSTWIADGGNYQVAIVSLSGRMPGLTSFVTATNLNTLHSPASTYTFPGGTAGSGDDLVVFQVYDPVQAWDGSSNSACTGSPGTFSMRGYLISSGWTPVAVCTLDAVSAGPTNSLSQVVPQPISSPTAGAGVSVWVISSRPASASAPLAPAFDDSVFADFNF